MHARLPEAGNGWAQPDLQSYGEASTVHATLREAGNSWQSSSTSSSKIDPAKFVWKTERPLHTPRFSFPFSVVSGILNRAGQQQQQVAPGAANVGRTCRCVGEIHHLLLAVVKIN